MIDGEMHGRPVMAVGAVVLDDDRILMVRRGHGPAAGEWSIPGGKVEYGETLAETVVREVYEETGISVLCDAMIGFVERIGEGFHFVIADFFAQALDSVEEPKAGSDAAEVRWVPVYDLCDLNLVDGLAEFLHENGVIPTLA